MWVHENYKTKLSDQINTSEVRVHFHPILSYGVCCGTGMKEKNYNDVCTGFIDSENYYQRQQMNPRCAPCRLLRHKLQISNAVRKRTLKNGTGYQKRRDRLRRKHKRLENKISWTSFVENP